MKRGSVIGNILWVTIFSSVSVLGLSACGGDSGPTPGSLAITTASLPEGILNGPYSTSVTGSGGALPYTWSVSPALPANLSLDTATGAITGTPTTQGTTSHTFTLRDSSAPSQTVEQTLSLTIDRPLSITTTSLPDASIGGAYNQPVQTVGGIGALTFSILLPGTGTLPQNLSLNPTTGIISGTPIAPAGTFPFTVRVADTGGQQDTQALSVRINPSTPPQITTTSLPGGTAGQPYNQRVQATGGIGTLAWSISAGSLPVGLILDPTAGTISGTPSSGGTSNFQLTATDSLGQFDTQNLSIAISAVLEITTMSLPAAREGERYSTTLGTSGGIPPVSWSVTPPLPDGLTLNPLTGEISGIPSGFAQGTHPLTFTVQDSAVPTPQTAIKQLDLTIDPSET
jgi:Putative Ig domain